MTHLVASMTLDSARSCAMQGAFLTQGKASSIHIVFSWGSRISPDGFLHSILLLAVIIFAVAIVVTVVLVVVDAIVGIIAAAQNTNNMTIRSEGKLAHLEQPLIPLPYHVASQAAGDAYNALYDAQNKVAWLMLGMSPELQRALENYKAHDMIQELKTMFKEQAKHEMFETVKAFHACKQEEGPSVSSYLLKMKSYLDILERLGYVMPKNLTIAKLHAIPKHHENGIPKKAETLAVLAIQKGKIQKDKKKPRGAKCKDKGKNNLADDLKPKIPPWPKIDNLAKDSICHQCKEGLRENRKLKHAPLSLYMGNGMRAAIEAIRSFDLILPSGLIIVLDNCHFAPFVTRGVVSIYRLVNNDGIYEIDMHNLYTNVSSMFNASNKKAKHALDSFYLWHYRLGHINKKRMDKLQRDGILQPTYDESLEKCKSCISGKMARKPFSHQVERAKDLLGLIHTDVCGPFRTMSREGASHFITFTDDFSRYGYVYLMKHKHEVFETFKDLNEPPNYKAALSDPEFNKWLEAINTKMQSMKDNQVWVLVDLPLNGQTVRSKWIFKKKTGMDGNVHTFKARLVVKGYTQTYGLDYEETFSPVADIRAIRILLAIAAFYDYKIWQMDDTAVKAILKYLRNTKDMVLVYAAKPEAELKSAKQSTTAMSSIEAEYIVAAEPSMEAAWMRKFIDGLGGVVPSNKRPMEMLCDNEPAIAITNDPIILKGARYFQRKYHYIRDNARIIHVYGCMLAIFHDMFEESVEVFMDDFSVFRSSFDHCLNNLDKMLQCCKDAHLVLNWEKCYFMVKEGIILEHKVSEVGLEVDKSKIKVIFELPPPINIKRRLQGKYAKGLRLLVKGLLLPSQVDAVG
nr:hypothetical protein [Tanacetum cinerariifolium]